jgi:hypothetical protein
MVLARAKRWQVESGPVRHSTACKYGSLPNGRDLFAILITLCFLLQSVFCFRTITPAGVQCPTAPVQTVVVKSQRCCEKSGHVVVRAPKPGDKGFVQCRCAEKKNGQQKSALSTKFDLYASTAKPLTTPLMPPSAYAAVSGEDRYRSVKFPPLILPPASA